MTDHTPHATTDSPIEERIATGLERLSQALRSHAWSDALPRGLTPTQGRILASLAHRSGVRLDAIAREVGVRPATASDAVRVLEDKGMVEKSRHAEDRRVLQIALTAEGRELAASAARWPEVLADATAELPEADKVVLLRAVVTMIRRLQETGRLPVARLCPTCSYFRPRVHDDPRRPHHCAFVDSAFGDAEIRVDCADHDPAEAPIANAAWREFIGGPR